MPKKDWEFKVVSSLAKIYPSAGTTSDFLPDVHSAFIGEEYSFQIAFRRTSGSNPSEILFSVDEATRKFITLSEVVNVPCDLAAFDDHDPFYDSDIPGLYPDLLKPLAENRLLIEDLSWHSIWVDFKVESPQDARSHQVHLAIRDTFDEALFTCELEIEILRAQLPPLDIIQTHWFHCDGLATYYDLEVFSEEHWKVIENFLLAARRLSCTAILTPIWTPPLDTEIGRYRKPTQLLEIERVGDSYTFDFSSLQRWIALAKKLGFSYLEIPHLFSQWGAAFAPAVYLGKPGIEPPIFGWHTSSTSPEYRNFLDQLLPQLIDFLSKEWDLNRIIFHISDEPHGPDQLISYKAAKNVVENHLSGFMVIDALSDFDLYRNKVVNFPVIANDAIEPFLQAHIENFMVYYCVAQNKKVSNRFFSLPSYRNRVIGHQLFTFKAKGFLHWGFNFYNSKLSINSIDPFEDTTASGAFPGGDSFLVYPGPNGQPRESIRFKVLTQAFNDFRAFTELANITSHAKVKSYIDTDGEGGSLKFDAFSTHPEYYFAIREKINREIMKHAPSNQ
jgi:Domain of unknown function (DUF4091)